jgi:hypothetical protein
MTELFPVPKIIKASFTKDSAEDVLNRIGVRRIKEQGKPTIWEYEGKTRVETNACISRFEEKVEEFTGYKIIYK